MIPDNGPSNANIVGNSTTVVKSGRGIIYSICINNNATGGTITIYDNTAASGTKLATIQIGSPSGGLLNTSGIPSSQVLSPLDWVFETGLTIVTAGSASNNITVKYE